MDGPKGQNYTTNSDWKKQFHFRNLHEKLEKSSPFDLKLHLYLLMFSPISMFLFIMTPWHLNTTKFKISISIWPFGYNAFALAIPFVSSTIRILFTNIPLITTRKVRGRSRSRSISTADTMSKMIKILLLLLQEVHIHII